MNSNEEDLLNCKKDIEILTNGKEYIEGLIKLDQDVEERLKSLASLCEGAFTSDNIDGLTSEEKKINEGLTNALLDMKEKVEREIAYLESQLRTLVAKE